MSSFLLKESLRFTVVSDGISNGCYIAKHILSRITCQGYSKESPKQLSFRFASTVMSEVSLGRSIHSFTSLPSPRMISTVSSASSL